MTESSRKSNTYAAYLPLIAGVLLLLFRKGAASHGTPGDALLYNGLFGLGAPLLFTFAGLFFARKMRELPSLKKRFRLLAGPFAAVIAVCLLYIIYLIAVDGSVEAVAGAVRGFFTRGLHPYFWFMPAGLILLTLLCFLKGHAPRPVLIATAALYAVSVLVCGYNAVNAPALSGVRSWLASVFQTSNCGVFSAGLFVLLGAKLAERGPRRSFRFYLAGAAISAAVCAGEVLLSLKFFYGDQACLFFASAPTAYCIVACFVKAGELKTEGLADPVRFGVSFLAASQFLCVIANRSLIYKDSLLSTLFSADRARFEMIVLPALLFSLLLCAFLSPDKGFSGIIVKDLQTLFLLVLRLPGRLSALLGPRVRGALCMLAAAGLPVLVYFYERAIAVSVCTAVFCVCLVVILFCALGRDMRPGGMHARFYLCFVLLSVLIFVSAVLSGAYAYRQVGRVMLYFMLPFAAVLAARKDAVRPLLRSMADGVYLAFGLFAVYCAMLRPYDITRYKGPFANANMCGLWCAAVFAVALCRVPFAADLKTVKNNLIHYIVAGGAFAFAVFTISRTAAVGCAAACAVRFAIALFGKSDTAPTLRGAKRFIRLAAAYAVMLALGLTFSYLTVRVVPAVTDMPDYLFSEFTNDDIYTEKVLPDAGIGDPHYISPARLVRAWVSRTVGSGDSLNEMATGRIGIYKTFLENLSFFGSSQMVLPVEGSDIPLFAHNAFLQIAFNCGIPMGLAYLALIAAAFVLGLRRGLRGEFTGAAAAVLLAAYGVCGCFESMESYYYPLLLGAMLAVCLVSLAPEPLPAAAKAGSAETAETETPAEAETPAETEAPDETETPAETEAPAEAEASTEVQTSSVQTAPQKKRRLLHIGLRLLLICALAAAFCVFAAAVLSAATGEIHTLLRQFT